MTRRGLLMGVGAAFVAGCRRTEGGTQATVAEGVPARPRADRLAFTDAGVALLTDDALLLHDLDGAPQRRIDVERGLGLCTLGSGALLAILREGDAMVALHVQAGKESRHPTRAARARAPLCLLPDPADAEGFWSITPDWSLAQRHTLRDPDPALRVARTVPLEPGLASDALPLRDGALLLATREGIAGAPDPIPWAARKGALQRLAAAGPDRAWALGHDGGLALVSLEGGQVLHETALGGRGLALAADALGCVAISAVRGPAEALVWTLHALDAAGGLLWTATGQGEPGRSLALGASRVALGDGSALAMWERAGGGKRTP